MTRGGDSRKDRERPAAERGGTAVQRRQVAVGKRTLTGELRSPNPVAEVAAPQKR
jgi:hypothetical protein